MKKKNFTAGWLMVGAATIFSSCSKDEIAEAVNGNEPVQVITMTVANSGDNFIRTRGAADRNLYSSDAKQSIENVKVVIFQLTDDPEADLNGEDVRNAMYSGTKTIVAQKLFTNWMNGGVSSVYDNHGRQASWTLKDADIIKTPGIYMAYAVGYNTANYTGLNTFHDLGKNGTATFPLDLQPAGGEVKEIFAGSTVFAVTNEKADDVDGVEQPDAFTFNASLTLHRQVAGSIGYFANIPIKGNKDHENKTGKKLRLVASGKNSNVVFAGFNSDFITTGNDIRYIVNGYNAADRDAKFYGSAVNDAYTVYEIELNRWFTEMDSNADGILNYADTWTNPLVGADVVKGSVLAGSFIIPFQLVADKATFQLQMLDSEEEIIRYWNIRLPESTTDSQIGKNVTLVAADGTEKNATIAENIFNYSIVRNHLYNIGTRDMGDNPTPPVDPENPNPGDKPQDLNNETLILKVNDNWEMIHQLDVD